MLEDGTYRSAQEIAETEGITRSFVTRLLRLTLLAPDIVEAILDGRQAKVLQLEDLTQALPSAWEEQRLCLLGDNLLGQPTPPAIDPQLQRHGPSRNRRANGGSSP